MSEETRPAVSQPQITDEMMGAALDAYLDAAPPAPHPGDTTTHVAQSVSIAGMHAALTAALQLQPAATSATTDGPPAAPVTPEGTWSLVEVMGHRRLLGVAREETRFGAPMLCLHAPVFAADGTITDWQEQLYTPQSLFSVSTVREDVALAELRKNAWRYHRHPDPAQALPAPDGDGCDLPDEGED
jgi:hypothetical protein